MKLFPVAKISLSCKNLIFSIHFCSILTDFSNLSFMIWRMLLQNNFHKCRSSRSQMLFKIAVLINFPIFRRKYLCWSPFLIQVAAGRLATLTKKRSLRLVFSCEYHKIVENSFFMQHYQWLLLNMVEELLRISISSYNTSHKFWDQHRRLYYQCCLQVSETFFWSKLGRCYPSNMLQHWIGGGAWFICVKWTSPEFP